MRWMMSGTRKRRTARIVLPNQARFPRTAWIPVGTGDFNRDERSDLLWWNQKRDALMVWFMHGSRRVGRATVDPNGATMQG
jgi:hypothetical protein